jgi:tetratricopeptide (TPR) repeat protein
MFVRGLLFFILFGGLFAGPAPAADQPTPLTQEQRGDVFEARKMYREAIDAYRESEVTARDKDKDKTKEAILEDKIGIAWHQLGDMNAALRSYERAVKLDPLYADAINNIGTVYYSRKRYGRAIREYERALKINPEAAAVWSNLGTAQYARRRFTEMAQAYAKALELDPTVFDARDGPGTRMQDRTVEDRARYHFEMAKVYAKAGRNELALQYLRKSLEEGFSDKAKINKEPEFEALRETTEFKDLMALEPRVL